MALKHPAEADRAVQEFTKVPLVEAFRLLTLEGDNGYSAGEFDRAAAPYEQALALQPGNSAARNNAAIAHSQAVLGDVAAYQRRAIARLSGILSLVPPRFYQWALFRNNLGNAWLFMPIGDKAENLRRASAAYESVLTVYTREAYPTDWALVRFNFGLALSSQAEAAGECSDWRAAISQVRAAGEVGTAEAFPNDDQTHVAPTLERLYSAWLAHHCGDSSAFDAVPPAE